MTSGFLKPSIHVRQREKEWVLGGKEERVREGEGGSSKKECAQNFMIILLPFGLDTSLFVYMTDAGIVSYCFIETIL